MDKLSGFNIKNSYRSLHKFIIVSLVTVSPGILTFRLQGQSKDTIHPAIYIAHYYKDRRAAITYTFDDGLKDQGTLAVPMLAKVDFKATFFIIPSRVKENDDPLADNFPKWQTVSWPMLKKMASNGHEISNHSWSHKNMPTLDDTTLQQEIEKADSLITCKMGSAPLTFCYPFNAVDARVRTAVMKNHIAAREYQFGMGGKFTAQKGNAWAASLIKDSAWGIAMIHGIAEGYDAFADQQALPEHLNYVKQREDKIWVSTFVNIARYTHERDSAKLTVSYKPHTISCVLQTSTLPAFYNHPLTLVVEIKNAAFALAKRAGKKLPVTIYPDRICIDIVPGPGPVTIKWK